MWCAYCLFEIKNAGDHRTCKEEIWWAMSQEYTATRIKFANQIDPEPKGETVEVRD